MLQHTENTFWAVDTVQLIECLPIKYETQGSIPCTAPLKQGMVVCITPDSGAETSGLGKFKLSSSTKEC